MRNRFRGNRITNEAMKGYDFLKDNGDLSLIFNIRNCLLKSDLKLSSQIILKKFVNFEDQNINFIIKQFLYSRLINLEFNAKILASIVNEKNISHPLPKIWQSYIEKYGIKVAKNKSTFLWYFFIFKNLTLGIFSALNIFIQSLSSLFLKRKNFDEKHSFFLDLNDLALSGDLSLSNSRNCINWYVNEIYKSESNITLYHQVKTQISPKEYNFFKVVYSKNILPDISSLNNIIKFYFNTLKYLLFSLKQWILGNPYNALLYFESINLIKINYLQNNELAKDYLFNNTNYLYRPLWTYGAEDKGSKILFYFYSIPHISMIIKSYGSSEIDYTWTILTWTKYYIWNKEHKNLLQNLLSYKSKFSISNPILISNDSIEFHNKNKLGIAVFDIQPFTNTSYKLFGLKEEYYIPDVVIKFLSDIQEVLSDLSIFMFYKNKREINNYLHPDFKYFKEKYLIINQNVIVLDPNISPITLINSSLASISLPFTSTGYLGLYLNKPSIYYDPTGLVNHLNPDVNNVEIISGKNNLKNWIENVILKNI
jgi:polysaccharide biosynthesis PFTS motif protein